MAAGRLASPFTDRLIQCVRDWVWNSPIEQLTCHQGYLSKRVLSIIETGRPILTLPHTHET